MKWCDVLYLRGGETLDLKAGLTKTNDWFELVKGKTIAGSSAGVYVLSTDYFGNDSQKLGKGLSILNLKSYCHFDEAKDMYVIEALSNVGNTDSEILVLPDYQCVVMFK